MRRTVWNWLGILVYWLGWPGLWWTLRGTRRTRVIVVAEGKILVVRGWMSDGRWQLPGGGLHRDEQPPAGAVREVYEEAGIRLPEHSLRLLAAERYKNRGLRFYCHYFAVELEQPPVPKLRGIEIAAAKWIPLREVTAKTCAPDALRALELLDGAG